MLKRLITTIAMIFLMTPVIAASSTTAEWTVMVFMNADNDLEPDGLIDFAEMARVGSTPAVNVVVQFDRIGLYTSDQPTDPQWTGTLRFRVTAGQEPVPANAVEDAGETNMGHPAALRQFVDWAMKKYPAKKYALVIWDHGDGYRRFTRRQVAVALDQNRLGDAFRSTSDSPHRAVSHDETSGDQLYNREIQDVLEAQLNAPLELIGFDACLMAMVETAYATRKIGKTMVASEELEPGTGWQYDAILRRLVSKPTMDGVELGRIIVDTYGERYGEASIDPDPETTLSAVDLRSIPTVAAAISNFSESIRAALQRELPHIVGARDACKEYAPGETFFHVDLVRFLSEYSARTSDPALRQAAKSLEAAIQRLVLARWVGKKRTGAFGSHGLAIYFPRSGDDYRADFREKGGYRKDNKDYPVEFVQKEKWADFLHAYFSVTVQP